MDVNQSITVRSASDDDYEAVAAFTRDTWADREAGDYIPHIYHDWIADDGDRKRTLVADAGDDIAGICQAVMLSPDEAWAQGMRVNPEYRGLGISITMNDALFEWAASRGAAVCRNMVFSWNVAGLGGSRAAGFEPVTEFRWAHPDPNPDAASELAVVSEPAVAWSYWTASPARNHLCGLALDSEESWAVSELTREDLRAAADETAVVAVADDGMRAMTYRTRTYERESDDGETERWAEYGVGAWDDLDAARALFAAISADAAAQGADRTRVLIPETPRVVSDAARLRVGISDEPDFVLGADLTDHW